MLVVLEPAFCWRRRSGSTWTAIEPCDEDDDEHNETIVGIETIFDLSAVISVL